MNTILTFPSVTYAQKAKKLLHREGIRADLVKVDPTQSSHGCTYGLRILYIDFYKASSILRSEGIEYGVYEKDARR